MGYLLTEIVVYLVIAGLIGFAFGWLVKAGALDKYFDKVAQLVKKPKEEVATKENAVEVASAKVAEVLKEEFKATKDSVKEVTQTEVNEEIKAAEPIKEEVIEETIVEVKKELEVEVTTPKETVEKIEDVAKPILLTEAPQAGQDKLSSIKGIGPVLEKKLNELGIYSFEQIASWNTEQEIWIGTQMAFPKRVTKEEWVKQAKELVENK